MSIEVAEWEHHALTGNGYNKLTPLFKFLVAQSFQTKSMSDFSFLFQPILTSIIWSVLYLFLKVELPTEASTSNHWILNHWNINLPINTVQDASAHKRPFFFQRQRNLLSSCWEPNEFKSTPKPQRKYCHF